MLVETVRSRTLLVASSLGLAAALVAWAAQPDRAEATSREPIRAWKACGKGKRMRPPVPVQKPVLLPAVTETYAETVQSIRSSLSRCMVDGGIDATVRITIAPTGEVRSALLEGTLGPRPGAFHSCVHAVVQPVRFRSSDSEVVVEMLVK